jgi:hypothetical protein
MQMNTIKLLTMLISKCYILGEVGVGAESLAVALYMPTFSIITLQYQLGICSARNCHQFLLTACTCLL